MNYDGSEYSKTSVYSGDTVTKPVTNPTAPGMKFIAWNFDFDQPITADTNITPNFEPTDSGLDFDEGSSEPSTDSPDNISNLPEDNSAENNLTNDPITDNSSNPVSEPSTEPVKEKNDNKEVTEESHELEKANAESPGLTGILLSQEYPSGSGTKYKDDPSRIVYVCDKAQMLPAFVMKHLKEQRISILLNFLKILQA